MPKLSFLIVTWLQAVNKNPLIPEKNVYLPRKYRYRKSFRGPCLFFSPRSRGFDSCCQRIFKSFLSWVFVDIIANQNQAMGKYGLCSSQLACNSSWVIPRITGNLNGPNRLEPCKMAKSCEEGIAANQRRSGSEGHKFGTWFQQGLFTEESPLKATLPLVICIQNIN